MDNKFSPYPDNLEDAVKLRKQIEYERDHPKPYKIVEHTNSGLEVLIYGEGSSREVYKTKKDYDRSKIYPWLVVAGWLLFGYIISKCNGG